MELTGDEKRIRALFSEVRFADEQAAPSFAATWHRAQSRAIQPRRAFNLSFVAATALLVFALGALALWSQYSQPRPGMDSAFATVQADSSLRAATVEPAGTTTPPVPVSPRVALAKSRRAKLAMERRALLLAENRKAEKQAQELGNWQSPTTTLLSSSSDELFKSLPQLNENANEMKSFLPNRSNDKEKQ